MSEIYADIFFLINFSMDFICLFLTGLILGKKTKIRRFVLGAALGGVYSVISLFIDLSSPLRFIITILSAFIICFSVFGNFHSPKNVLFPTFLFISVSFFMGGALTYLYSSLGKYFTKAQSEQDLSILLLPASLICGVLSYVVSRISQKRLSAKRFDIVVVTEKECCFSALCDSGNLLCEPISRLPVIILSKKASLNYIKSGIFTPYEAAKYPEVSGKIRIIPAKSAFSQGMLTGFIPQGVLIEGKTKKCCIAFSENEDFGGCDCLVPTVLL